MQCFLSVLEYWPIHIVHSREKRNGQSYYFVFFIEFIISAYIVRLGLFLRLVLSCGPIALGFVS